MEVLNEDMTDGVSRKKFNLSLPPVLMDEFERIAKRYGPKKKGLVLSAAVATFISLPEEDQDAMVQAMAAAEVVGEFQVVREGWRLMKVIPGMADPGDASDGKSRRRAAKTKPPLSE